VTYSSQKRGHRQRRAEDLAENLTKRQANWAAKRASRSGVAIVSPMKTKSLQILERAMLPSAQARAILEVMEAEFTTETLATKIDLERFATKADLQAFAAAAKVDLSNAKAELTRWMFVFWAGQLAAMYAMVRLLK
jgi:hypothetical protein